LATFGVKPGPDGVIGGGVGRILLPPPPPPQADNASAMAAGNKVPASRSCRRDARLLSIFPRLDA